MVIQQLFGPEVRVMLAENDVEGMQAFCETLHPATVAESLAEMFAIDEVWRCLETTSIRNQAAIFEYFPLDWQVEMVQGAGQQKIARLIEQMSHDDRVDLLRRLKPRVAQALLRLVDEAERRDIATLFRHEEDSAGSIMTTDYAWVPANITAAEALDRLRLQAPDKETIYYVYVLNNGNDRRLLGVVSLRGLILAPRSKPIKDLLDEHVFSVRVNEDKEQVAQEMARYDLLAMPVVDDQNRLVGIVTHDDVIDVVVEEATEDAHRMGAVDPIDENYLEADFFTVWRKRAFWLACLFIGGMLTFNALAQYQNTLSTVVVLSMFIPLCISTGGNSGSQAATLITRAMALGQVGGKDWLRVLRHELLMGLALGVTLGALGFARAYYTPSYLLQTTDPVMLGVVIALAVVGICIWGTVVGSMLPLILQRVGIDPAIASNPFVATLVDVTGILIYFSIANAFLLPAG